MQPICLVRIRGATAVYANGSINPVLRLHLFCVCESYVLSEIDALDISMHLSVTMMLPSIL